jgi:hypothetical protein
VTTVTLLCDCRLPSLRNLVQPLTPGLLESSISFRTNVTHSALVCLIPLIVTRVSGHPKIFPQFSVTSNLAFDRNFVQS